LFTWNISNLFSWGCLKVFRYLGCKVIVCLAFLFSYNFGLISSFFKGYVFFELILCWGFYLEFFLVIEIIRLEPQKFLPKNLLNIIGPSGLKKREAELGQWRKRVFNL
jgi:hypothetical protein